MSPAVFLGTVQSVRSSINETNLPIQRVYFSVQEVFRGITRNSAEVVTNPATLLDNPRIPEFLPGVQYLVFATGINSDGQIEINPCNPTRPVSEVWADLEILRSIKSSPPRPMIYGNARRVSSTSPDANDEHAAPLSGVRIQAQGPEETLEAITNNDGNYSIQLLSGGAYTIRALFPEKFRESNPLHVQLSEHECLQMDFQTQYNGRIRGVITDFNGHALKLVSVQLMAVDDSGNKRVADETTDEYGSFEFANLVPGNYFFGVNIDSAPDSDSPYVPTYYPGVSNVGTGAKIMLGEGEIFEAHNFQIQAAIKRQQIPVRVLWPDGMVAKDAVLEVEYPNGSWTYTARSDPAGRAKITFYGNDKVQLRAYVVDASKKKIESEAVEIFLTNIPDLLNLKLTRSTE